ncbi:MAG: hypothetical protein U9P90_02080 [Patescibacteria group bacterium]|nr:hypothetical protein [Patescibacteria group bacterium]
MNKLLEKITKKIQEETWKEFKPEYDKKLNEIKGNETGAELNSEQSKEINNLYKRKYKEKFNKIYAVKIEKIKEFIKTDSWMLLQELFLLIESENFEKASFTEKKAFQGFQKELVENILKAPQELVDVYEKLQKE